MSASKATGAKKAASSTTADETSSDSPDSPGAVEDGPEGGFDPTRVEDGVEQTAPLDAPAAEPPAAREAFALVDPEPLAAEMVPSEAVFVPPMVTVVAVRNEVSVLVGEAHYSLRAGTTLTVQQHVADELVNRKLVRAL